MFNQLSYWRCFIPLFTVPPSLNQTLPAAKRTKKEHETVSYACAAYAKPAANIMWMLDGELLKDKPPFAISSVLPPPSQSKKLRETLSYLTIKNVSWREAGAYSCLAYNVAGQTRQVTELEIQCKCILEGPFWELEQWFNAEVWYWVGAHLDPCVLIWVISFFDAFVGVLQTRLSGLLSVNSLALKWRTISCGIYWNNVQKLRS